MDNLFNNIYKNRKVLITGHTGFKGSWLAFWLQNMGADVVGYSLESPTQPSHFDLLKMDIHSIIGDIRNLNTLCNAFERHQPDIVFHLAAQPLVRLSYSHPKETIDTNIMGTVNVFEACRQCPSVKAVINITSDKCYDNKEWVWGYREIDPMGGYDPYSASKGCSELITAAYRKSFFNPNSYGKSHSLLLASARAGNVIGGGDWAQDRLVPDIIRSVEKKNKIMIRSPGSTRPWQHVLDPLSGYLYLGQQLLMGKKDYAGAWNFGPDTNKEYTVVEVVNFFKKFWDAVDYEVDQNSNNPHEAHLLKLDCSKALFYLKWKSIWNNNIAFEKTINWYKAYYTNNSLLTSDDLYNFIQSAKNANAKWAMNDE